VKTAYSVFDVLVAPTRTGTTVAGGAGAGAGATVSIDGSTVCGTITVAAAGVPSAGGIIATVTFDLAFPNSTIPIVTLTPVNLAAGNFTGTGTPWVSAQSDTGFVINAPTAPLVAGTTYIWNYQIGFKYGV
jgi:hypothetical protein